MNSSQLQWTAAIPPLPLVMLQIQERQAAFNWGNLSQQQQHSLIRWLFCSDGVWPDRRPRQEVLGLLMLLKRLLFGGPTPQPFDRSLVPRRS
jgi:cellulose synthase (UDP-forming)